jgi:serine/threonine protein kinase
MDPLILKKLNSRGKKARQLGYDQKADIWSLGAICYEMLIGKAAFDADDMDELVQKIEAGKYKVPTTLSKEVVSFLNGMLQYDSISRLNIEQLAAHPFLTKNINEFKSIDLRAVSNKLDDDNKEIVIDVKNNTSIWAIFNKEDENKLMGISPGNLTPINENHRNRSQEKKQQNNNGSEEDDNPIRQANTFQMKNPNMNNIMYQNNFGNSNPNNFSGPILLPAMQGIPGNPFCQNPMQNYPGGFSFSSAPMTESNYSFSGGIYN